MAMLSCFPGLEEVVFVANLVETESEEETYIDDADDGLGFDEWWSPATHREFAGNETLLVPFHEYELLPCKQPFRRAFSIPAWFMSGDTVSGEKLRSF